VGVGLTGRDLFAFNPEMFEDDESALNADYTHREEDEVGLFDIESCWEEEYN
jgi:hypothetical protein